MTAVKSAAKSTGGMKLAIHEPTRPPARMPGVTFLAMSQRIAPRAACARTLAAEAQHSGEETHDRSDGGIAEPPLHALAHAFSASQARTRVFSAVVMCSPHLVRRHSTSSGSRAHSFLTRYSSSRS